MATRQTELDELGYTILEGYMGDSMLNRMLARVDELFAIEGEAAGSEFALRRTRGAWRISSIKARYSARRLCGKKF